jgi:glycosyltransferase involved in cell wall biosynthesis
MKKLSVITINYNNAVGLETTFASICHETFPNNLVEYIVIDGGSSDHSIDLIKKYESFITYWVSEKDNGIFHAMNKGLNKAEGEYTIFMNSGDSFVEGVLCESFINRLEGAHIIYGNIFLENRGLISSLKQTPTLDFFYMIGKTVCHQSIFMKTTLCMKYSFPEDKEYSIMGDWIQLFSLLKNENLDVLYLDQPICIYNGEGQSEQYKELRHHQRNKYLGQFYSQWELRQFKELHRLRNRNYYHLFIRSLDRYYLSRILNVFSKWLKH